MNHIGGNLDNLTSDELVTHCDGINVLDLLTRLLADKISAQSTEIAILTSTMQEAEAELEKLPKIITALNNEIMILENQVNELEAQLRAVRKMR